MNNDIEACELPEKKETAVIEEMAVTEETAVTETPPDEEKNAAVAEVSQPPKRKVTFGMAYGHFALLFTALCVMLIVTCVFQAMVALIAKFYFPEIIDTEWFKWVSSVGPMYCLGFPAAVIIMHLAERDREGIVKEKFSFGAWLRCFCISIAFIFIGGIVGTIVASRLGSLNNSIGDLLADSSPWISLKVTVILAPIIEELLFRRLLIDRMSAYGEKTAIFVSALAFGLFHGNFNQFFYAFAIGLLFGYIYVRTRRILYTITLHMAVNLVCSAVTSYIVNAMSSVGDKAEILEASGGAISKSELLSVFFGMILPLLLVILYCVVVFIVFIMGILFFIKGLKKVHLEKCRYEISPCKRRFAVYTNIGFILLVAICAGIFVLSM